MANDKIIIADQAIFEEMLNSNIPVLVDFWAEWCAPCRMVAPILDELADEYEGRVKICKVNTEDFEDIASRYGVKGIPTFILLKDGQAVDKMVGAMPKSSFNSFLEKNLRYE